LVNSGIQFEVALGPANAGKAGVALGLGIRLLDPFHFTGLDGNQT
jgi:hypothetical protein